MKKVLIFLVMIFSLQSISQTGGRKLEKTNTIRRWKLFKKSPKTSPWIYRKTESGPVQKLEMPKLFRRTRTNGQKQNEKIIERQKKLRAKKRVRGNSVFYKRKYF